MTDTELLQKFAKTRDAEAFAELVRRHVDVVYAAARRQAGGDSHLAEDITQRVFILLSQKAASLNTDVLLGGWLFNAVRFVARNELRRVHRQKNQETKTAVMAEESRKASAPSKPPAWDDVESVLDDAMAKLDQQTRGMLVLRYFEGKTAREVGDRLGISEDAARKRLSRAVDQLRGIFARRGVVLSAAEIAQGLALPVIHAPAHIATSAALAAASSASASASASGSILKGAMAIMAYAKSQTVVVSIVGLIVAGGIVAGGAKLISAITAPGGGARTIHLVQSGPTLSGVVRDASGKPVAGAKVFVATEKMPMYLPTSTTGRRVAPSPVSDADGKYTVVKPEPPFAVFVVSNSGIAQASWEKLKAGSDLTVEPFSNIEGTIQVGDKPLPRGNISIWRVQQQDDPWMKLMHVEANTNADATGHFIFRDVPAGEYWVFNRPRPNSAGSEHWRYVQVEAGKTATVKLGGSGLQVTGHVDVPADVAHFVDWMNRDALSYMASLVRTDIPRTRPAHRPGETPEQFTDIELRFGQTDAGQATNQAMFESAFNIRPDGTFTIDGVAPGKYRVNIRNLQDQPNVNFSEDVAGGETEVVVPPDSQGAVEIGGIALKAVEHHARAGDVAPDFAVTTTDGKLWKLSDQKGKAVVLYFWSTYRQNMGEELFGPFADRWSKDPNVSILGICLVDDAQNKDGKLQSSTAEKMQFHFPQCTDGERLLKLYDTSWPAGILIDKTGKIVQKNLSGQPLNKAMKAFVSP